jgi:hypothetical protein
MLNEVFKNDKLVLSLILLLVFVCFLRKKISSQKENFRLSRSTRW